jgi:polyhydroxybutyrate depolymerase
VKEAMRSFLKPVLSRRFTYACAAVLWALAAACGLSAPSDPVPAVLPPGEPIEAAPAGEAEREQWAPGNHYLSMGFDGEERIYILHIPTGYDPLQPAPLVLAFHGIGLDAGEMARISGLNAEADRSGFIAAYPDGTGNKKSWNGGRCCGEAAREQVDDVSFTSALIDEISRLVAVDANRVYATGFSNGAIFVYRLGCELADRIAAIGPVSATQFLDDQRACSPSRPIPVIHFHGTADRLNPYDGGTMASGLEVVSVEEAAAFWAQNNACSGPPSETRSGSIQHRVYSGCASGSDVELYIIEGGEHAWPGGEAVSAAVGQPNMEISASSLMWAFFAAHPMP